MALKLLLALAISFRAEPGLEKQAERLAPIAEQQLAAIEADLEGLPQVERVEVRLVKHASDLQGVPELAVGVAYPERGLIMIAARDRNGDLVAMEHTLAHELAHVALHAAIGPWDPLESTCRHASLSIL